ncbi:MAG: AmmeMemoRadiSam system protein B [Candidatus Cloacimonetes bacterium]|nr:AmmeMemoRadiSam system protein B [Candidatus Cloacimonadota bacterium]HOH79733.1 AmmeMemoRadiSam system protein B [Candidatus Cloacimonadota bacterium]HPN40944.1 AmmeMemoRadiSam system protein B [Candidatus Cloacimonadota bacterium]
MIRKATHAGKFYPRFGYAIISQLAGWTAESRKAPHTEHSLGLIVPHAGYMYSGAIAARAYHHISEEGFDAFVVLHPSHHGGNFDYSVSAFQEYETPLGNIRLDTECYAALTSGDEPSDLWLRYHEQEHSMEIQLPMIKYFFPDARICPVMLGRQNLNNSRRLADRISYLLTQTSRRVAIIASTDLSHYHDAASAETKDKLLAKLVQEQAIDDLWDLINDGDCEACGIGAILTLLCLGSNVPGAKMQVLEYTHSGLVSGHNQQVVGYLAAKLWR